MCKSLVLTGCPLSLPRRCPDWSMYWIRIALILTNWRDFSARGFRMRRELYVSTAGRSFWAICLKISRFGLIKLASRPRRTRTSFECSCQKISFLSIPSFYGESTLASNNCRVIFRFGSKSKKTRHVHTHNSLSLQLRSKKSWSLTWPVQDAKNSGWLTETTNLRINNLLETRICKRRRIDTITWRVFCTSTPS